MRFLSLFLPEIKIHSIGLFRVSLVENIIIPQGVVDMDKRIATINKGHVVESGTPNELLNNPSSLYKEMYDLNTSKYIKL